MCWRTVVANTGRPSKRTDEIVNEIVERVRNGETLTGVCRQPHMPHPSTFHDWKNGDPELSQRFARAKDEGFDAIAADCLTIADDQSDEPASRRVRTETRLKLLAKWDPKRYGERLNLASDDGSMSPAVTPEKAEERLIELMRLAQERAKGGA